jgi:hypothetical protein
MKTRLITAIILYLILTGCASIKSGQGQSSKPSGPLPPSTRPTYNLAGYPPAFKDGYIDGCETAKKTSYGFKDKHRFSKDSQYRNGWKDGFNICLSK